jgi:glycerol uptake facilitator-like aquaporin
MTSFPPSSRLASEALGTALLVATVVGSGTMADRLTTDTALALLANTLATGAILVVLITILGADFRRSLQSGRVAGFRAAP